MLTIEYRVIYDDGDTEDVKVRARDINAGFVTALKEARTPLGNGRVREISSISFWIVTDY